MLLVICELYILDLLFYELRPEHLRHLVTTSAAFKSTTGGPEPPTGHGPSSGKGPDGIAGSFGGGKKGSGTGKGKDGQLSCPRCGDPCTFVETFVCKSLY